jgi:hypothetical protein
MMSCLVVCPEQLILSGWVVEYPLIIGLSQVYDALLPSISVLECFDHCCCDDAFVYELQPCAAVPYEMCEVERVLDGLGEADWRCDSSSERSIANLLKLFAEVLCAQQQLICATLTELTLIHRAGVFNWVALCSWPLCSGLVDGLKLSKAEKKCCSCGKDAGLAQ